MKTEEEGSDYLVDHSIVMYVNLFLFFLLLCFLPVIFMVISLFYIDFGNISQFPYFSGINPALAENPIFSGTQTTSE